MKSEDLYIKNIENGIRAIRMNTKKPADVGASISAQFTKLKAVNEGMHDDLMVKYKNVVKDFNNKNQDLTN